MFSNWNDDVGFMLYINDLEERESKDADSERGLGLGQQAPDPFFQQLSMRKKSIGCYEEE